MAHGSLKRVRRATPSIVPRFYLTRRQPWHASSASRTCCCATFHTRPSSARAALADPRRTASERELVTAVRRWRTTSPYPSFLPSPTSKPVSRRSMALKQSANTPVRRRVHHDAGGGWRPPRHFPLILLPNHSVLVPLHGDLNVSFIVRRLEDGSALLASRRCFSPDFHPFLNF